MKNLFQIAGVILFVLIGYTGALAQGDLMIFPKRMVFKDGQRSQDFTLINNGKNTATYRISMVNYRMTENGQFEKITQPDSGQHFADQNLRIFPRSVTLSPNETQKVKVQVYRNNQLKGGEYRSHLFFQAAQDQKALGKTVVDEKTKGIITKININFGISIPIIIEVGDSPVSASLSDVSLETKGLDAPKLQFTIHRKGDKSLYGDLIIIHTDPSGKETEIGSVKGVAVYAPISQRHFSIILDIMEEVDYSSGQLAVVYYAHKKIERLAEAELVLK